MNETFIEPRRPLAAIGLMELWQHRHLLGYFVLRMLRARYRPTRLGYFWLIGRPVLLCVAYVLVVGYLFQIDTSPVPFPLFVFLGVSVFLFFAGGVTDSMSSLVNNANIISKVYYPRLIAPLTTLLANFIDLLAALAVVALLMVFYGIAPGANALLAPLYLLGILGATLALGLIGAARTVYVRDLLLMMPSFMRVAIYTMPCVYPAALVPERFQALYYANPLAVYMQGLRFCLLNDVSPPSWSIYLASFLVLVALWYGLAYFNRVERSMVDTL